MDNMIRKFTIRLTDKDNENLSILRGHLGLYQDSAVIRYLMVKEVERIKNKK